MTESTLVFANKDEASAKKELLKTQLPAAASAYKPSGKTSKGTRLHLVKGGLLGIAVSVPVALLIVLVGAGLWETSRGAAGSGKMLWLIMPAMFILALATYIGQLAGIGGVVASQVADAGKKGKNRSMKLGSYYAAAAAALAVIPFWIVMQFMPQFMRKRLLLKFFGGIFGAGAAPVVCLAVGALISVIVASMVAVTRVYGEKLCETCEEYMAKVNKKAVSFASAQEGVGLLKKGSLAEAAAALKRDTGPDRNGWLLREHCPKCGAGFDEVSMVFSGKYPKPARKGNSIS